MVFSKNFQRAITRRFYCTNNNLPPVPAPHSADSAKLWEKVYFFICIPAMIACGIKCYPEMKEEKHERGPEFIPYDHLRIRRKPFPWGDGQHTLFHNPIKNALPDGYEA